MIELYKIKLTKVKLVIMEMCLIIRMYLAEYLYMLYRRTDWMYMRSFMFDINTVSVYCLLIASFMLSDV